MQNSFLHEAYGFHWSCQISWFLIIMTRHCSLIIVFGYFSESLLLGSLLWFLGIMCLFSRPARLQSNLVAVTLEKVEKKQVQDLITRAQTIRYQQDPTLKAKVDAKSQDLQKEFDQYMQAH